MRALLGADGLAGGGARSGLSASPARGPGRARRSGQAPACCLGLGSQGEGPVPVGDRAAGKMLGFKTQFNQSQEDPWSQCPADYLLQCFLRDRHSSDFFRFYSAGIR